MKIEQKNTDSSCALCGVCLDLRSVVDGHHSFCCTGCHAVFQILDSRQQLEGFRENPLFLQALQSGLISNPAILEEIRQQRDVNPIVERERFHVEIRDMWCPSCAEIIRLVLLRQKGVINCVIDYTTDFASIEFSPRMISKDTILAHILRLGYAAHPLTIAEERPVNRDLLLRFGVAAFCAVNIMMLAYPLYATYFDFDGEGYGILFAWMSAALSIPVLTYSAWPLWRRLWNTVREGILGMEVLIAIGASAAAFLSLYNLILGSTNVYFDSLSALIAFTLLGKIIESRAKFSAKHSLLKLVRSTPRRGRKRFPDGSLKYVPLKEVNKGDTLVACSGEKISLDGVVVEGEGACDESLMTGEALPITKKVGDSILAGTMLVQGSISYRVACGLEETALSRIMDMIEQGASSKTHYVRSVDTIVQWFIPLVLFVAVTTGAFTLASFSLSEAIVRVLAILLIACPCAIGIATPTAESYLLNALGSLGVIVRNRGALSLFGNESVIVFDKTGTVTEGRYGVLEGGESLLKEDRQALASIVARSNHPVACALASSLAADAQQPLEFFEEVVGHGMRGKVEGIEYHIGSERFLVLNGIKVLKHASTDVLASHVLVARNGDFLTSFALGDQIRPEIQKLLQVLRPAKTVLLSGDGEIVVKSVAQACGFDAWKSGCTPLEKRDFIDQLKKDGNTVCMVGDGINDALALTAADVGISVVSATDISIQVSDLLLTTDRLGVIAEARTLARFGQKIAKQNLFWAFVYNVVGVALACFGFLSPIFSAFAMSVSSLSVLFNAKRLGRQNKQND